MSARNRIRPDRERAALRMAGIFRCALAAALLVSSLGARAGEVSAGRALASSCTGCHGSSGISVNDQWPSLAGQKAGYLEAQLRAFRAGTRSSPIMNAFAHSLTNRDIDDLAAYFSNLQPKRCVSR